MIFDSITNRGEFFSNHYLDAVLHGDLKTLQQQWDATEGHEPTARSRVRGLGRAFFPARAAATEAPPARRAETLIALNDVVLAGLGFTPEQPRGTVELERAGEAMTVTVAARVDTSTGLLLVALDAGLALAVDDLFADTDADGPGTTASAASAAKGATATPGTDANIDAGRLLEPLTRPADKLVVTSAIDAVGELFATDEAPRFVLVMAGTTVLLADRATWSEGRFLAVDLDTAIGRNDTRRNGELETIAALFSADALVPHDGQSVLDELVAKSHKHAIGVSKELREGMRRSIEILANEVITQLDTQAREGRRKLFTRTDVDAKDLTRQCLRYLYRLVVLLYAESRRELGIVPVDDDAYLAGYSLDRLRELCLVDLASDHARHGSHLDESLQLLFDLVNGGYHADSSVAQALVFDATDTDLRSTEDYLVFPGLDAALFDPAATPLLNEARLRNEALQRVLSLLMLSKEGKGKKKERGFISYAQLGINQLGAVYEGLMAYTGFFASTDLNEIARHGEADTGTWVIPIDKADEYPDDVFVTLEDPITGQARRVHYLAGSFVYRLSGRDRQRSASYYTPEVLTRCVVKHALAELLDQNDRTTTAGEILDLTICEPALGSGAFLNEAVNQLGAEYLHRRQRELGELLDPDTYREELQKVKAHLALNQCYGVDLNPTAVELAEVSLWLNCMHPGLKAPWFGLNLRTGNSLIGCRRATYPTDRLAAKPWLDTAPTDRPLTQRSLPTGELHHFLLPGHGWAAVADRKEAAELRPEGTKALKAWRKEIHKAPAKHDAERLLALAAAVETAWTTAAERLRLVERELRRPIEVWRASPTLERTGMSREVAEQTLGDPGSALGRLRLVMDAWIGLWYWPLETHVAPPSWKQWLTALDELLGAGEGRTVPAGQLDLFADLDALLAHEKRTQELRRPVTALLVEHPWLALARDQAREARAWHWELELAPAFLRGGFDLQVGNPPWVRPRWEDDLALAELDPWFGVTDNPPVAAFKARRAAALAETTDQDRYLADVASSEAATTLLGSVVLHPVLKGVQTNLYMVFMDTTWRHTAPSGTVGMLHPESHFVDPKGGPLRRATYARLRRHWQFVNEGGLFEDIHNMTNFGIHVYSTSQRISFRQISALLDPQMADDSLEHDGTGEVPTIQYPSGGWDLRPHAQRVVTVDEDVLASWAALFDEPGTPAAEARLLRPVTRADLDALAVLARQPVRLGDHAYFWTSGWHEKGAKEDGTIRWETAVPASWDEVILQGPHFTIATPFAKQPNENCSSNRDYSDWDLEHLPAQVIPRTNYQRACGRDTYDSRIQHWNGSISTGYWRLLHRRMVGTGAERSVQPTLICPGPSHVNTCHTIGFLSNSMLTSVVGFWSSLPFDFLQRVSGKADLQDEMAKRFPMPDPGPLGSSLLLRTLRLSCLTADYAPLWEELFDRSWKADRWTDPALGRIALGEVGPEWSMAAPLRRDQERRLALVELDALAALILGLTSEQLCAMYRTQFAVLRKYEYRMVFDVEGRKITKEHHAHGFRQAHLQDEARAGRGPDEWKNLWSLFEQWEADPGSVDWRGQYTPPFTRADREMEMTRAYREFQRRLDAAEYR